MPADIPRIPHSEGWMTSGACVRTTPRALGVIDDMFFDNPAYFPQALAMCQKCPVLNLCREWTLETDRRYPVGHLVGVSGGMSTDERRQARAYWDSQEDVA